MGVGKEFEHYKFVADKGQNPLRVDRYLQNFVEFSTRSKIQQAVKAGNVRVNNLCPGALDSHVAGSAKKQSTRFVSNFIKLAPMKRLGKASEIANVALFLGSDLSSYMTGQSIYVDGGYTII